MWLILISRVIKTDINIVKIGFHFSDHFNWLAYIIFALNPFADTHRQRIINWIDGTGQLSAAFDFTTKGILQVIGILHEHCISLDFATLKKTY